MRTDMEESELERNIYGIIDSFIKQTGEKPCFWRPLYYYEFIQILLAVFLVFDFHKETDTLLQEELTFSTAKLYTACEEHWKQTKKEYQPISRKE